MHGNQVCPCRESVGWESESQKSPRVKSAGNCVWGEETLSYVYTIRRGILDIMRLGILVTG